MANYFMSELSEVLVKQHTIETWRVNPRVHYFARRYRDLLPRFKRVIESFPKSFQVEKSINEIEEINDEFTKKMVVNVFGDSELDLANIVVSTKPLEMEKISDLNEPSRISLSLCYSKTERLDRTGLQSVTSVIQRFCDDIGNEKPHVFENMFVVIDTEVSQTEKEQDAFRKEVHEFIHSKHERTDVRTCEDRIIFGSHDTVLGSKISELLEMKIEEGFHKEMIYLERFVRKTKQYDSDIDIIHTDLGVKSIQAFLRDDIGLADMRQIAESDTSKETEGMSVDEKFLQLLLNKLARLVKCAIVEPCSTKYNIPPWVVNLLLEEIRFEGKLVDSVSKNTRHHLRKLNDFSKDFDAILKTHKRKADMGRGQHGASKHEYFIRFVSYKFDFIVYPLQNDMAKVISDAEKTMASAGQIIIIMGKMLLEIEGYLEQTITEKYELKTQNPAVPKDLKDAILELKDVYATGTVYDVFEIHAKDETPLLKEDVTTLMRKYGYTQPYRVKTITKEPVKMMADIQHENGKLIKSPFPGNKAKYREGTLGCFAENGTKKLYVCTCAHVVENPDKDEHDVLIQDRAQRLKKIGKSTRNLTVCFGTGEMPVIDIAAVTINEDFEKQCIRKMKDECGVNKTAVVPTETVTQLLKRFVYKHGAKSGLTKGIICSCDFALSGFSDDDYPLLMESLPGSGEECFAEEPKDIKDAILERARYQHVYLTNKGAHAYNGNGPGDRNDQPSRSTSRSVVTSEHSFTSLENRRKSDESTTTNIYEDSENLSSNKRKRGSPTEILQETKRLKEEISPQNIEKKATESPCHLLQSNCIPNTKQLNTIAHHIGQEWQSLGFQLGLSDTELYRIREEKNCVVDRITDMLLKWKQKCGNKASFKVLANAMKMVQINPLHVFNNL